MPSTCLLVEPPFWLFVEPPTCLLVEPHRAWYRASARLTLVKVHPSLQHGQPSHNSLYSLGDYLSKWKVSNVLLLWKYFTDHDSCIGIRQTLYDVIIWKNEVHTMFSDRILKFHHIFNVPLWSKEFFKIKNLTVRHRLILSTSNLINIQIRICNGNWLNA